jgi:hypothetical protein
MWGEWIFMCGAWAFVGCNFIFVIMVSNSRIFGF